MTSSIWDTRFNNQSVAQDADEGEGQWITMHGAHIMIDDKGTIIAGANGKFNGKTVDEVKAERKQALKQAREAKRRLLVEQARAEYRKAKANAETAQKQERRLKRLEREEHSNPEELTNEELLKERNKISQRIEELKNTEWDEKNSRRVSNLMSFLQDRNEFIDREKLYRKLKDEKAQRIDKTDPAKMSDKRLKREWDKAEDIVYRAEKALRAAQKRDGMGITIYDQRDHPAERAFMDAWADRARDLESEVEAREEREESKWHR